jgi:hypothetical protein
MAYTLNKSNGDVLATVVDGVNDTTTTNITLIAKNSTGYGEALNENFIKLLENFSKSSAPSAPIEGQLWWNTVDKILSVYHGTVWKPLSHAVTSTTAPSSAPSSGDLWWDSTTSQLKAYSGSAWLLVGPQTPAGTPTTTFTGNAVTDTLSVSHTVGNLIVNNKLAAIVSTDATAFTPIITYTGTGITRVNPGINFTSTAEPTMISSPNMTLGVVSSNVQISSLKNNQGINFTANVGGTVQSVLYISGSTGDASFGGNVTFPSTAPVSISQVSSNILPTANLVQNLGSTSSHWGNLYVGSVIGSGTSSFGNIITNNGLFWANGVSFVSTISIDLSAVGQSILPSANLTYNLGSPSAYWNNVYGTAIHAQYADLAERFEADTEYSPGTVVELGGPAEITAAVEELSENVFGVISTKAAYLMNSGAGTNQTHPPIAVQGRVPVKVTGRIRKGDRLVSAGNGIARAGSRSEITAWNVIGRALENKLDDGEGIIEAVVKLNS